MSHPHHVLLIDDNRHGLIARRTVLEEAGYLVETAKNGQEGIEKFHAAAFDIVVTDYRMPGTSGSQVVAHLLQAKPRVPVVILSGYVKSLGLTEESTGADLVLSKGPAEPQDLLRAVARLLRKKPASQRKTRSRGNAAS